MHSFSKHWQPVPPMNLLLNPQFEGATVLSRSAFEDLNSLLLGVVHCLQMEYTLIVWHFLLIEFVCEQLCLEVQLPDRAKAEKPCTIILFLLPSSFMTQYIWHRGRHEETILGAPVFPLYCYVL
jgi:hypothetical protein